MIERGSKVVSRKFPPIHPGEILLQEFLRPLGITQYRLARDISVPPRRINEIVHGERAISADTALRLARYFGNSERFWLNLQARYDLDVQKDRLRDRLTKEVIVLTDKARDRPPRRREKRLPSGSGADLGAVRDGR
ncbi:MAG: HigA family addiction module antidote protein [Armatimonadetes bacterium]|nr:HigA family addiction module antidote protein [Armatimonadota bacterium]